MGVIVQKFGGTSVAIMRRIHPLAARHAVRAKPVDKSCWSSAMGHTTDRLIDPRIKFRSGPGRREMDMLISTGEQVSIADGDGDTRDGLRSDQPDGRKSGCGRTAGPRTRIQSIDTDRIRGLLDAGKIVIVAGFQGVDPDFNITTLGPRRQRYDRGKASRSLLLAGGDARDLYRRGRRLHRPIRASCRCWRRIEAISYDEMLGLASAGAGVMHGRAMELGKVRRADQCAQQFHRHSGNPDHEQHTGHGRWSSSAGEPQRRRRAA